MHKDSQRTHRRESLRIKQYDYSAPNAYFFTVCTFHKELRFGEVLKGQMHLNEEGKIVWDVWEALGKRYSTLETDAFVVMPNHVHGIVKITIDEVGAIHELPLQADEDDGPVEKRFLRRRMLLPKAIGYLKMNASKRINQSRGTPDARFWQRNYYEHVIRNDKALRRLRTYIEANPINWMKDPERITK